MSLEKAIKYKKEHRKDYHGAKAIDKSCRNHGDCPICLGNRLYSSKKRINSLKDKEKFFINEME